MARPKKTELDTAVGQRMKQHLREQGIELTYEELGQRLGFSGPTVNRWFLHGRAPSRVAIQRFAEVFEADETWLATGVRAMTPGEAIIKFGALVAQHMDPRRAYSSITGEEIPLEDEAPLAAAATMLVEIIRSEAGPDLDRLSGSQVEETAERALSPLVAERESRREDGKTPAPIGRLAPLTARKRP